MLFSAVTRSLQSAPIVPEAGITTLNHDFVRQLFTSASGTSIATPLLARKAALLLQRFPEASANLVRALLAGAASFPDEMTTRLQAMDALETASVVGNGLVDPVKAVYSDDHRVIYFAEDQLDIDKFAIYRIPIPVEFQTGGKRTIRISLAYDPPVRRTRADYLGTKMDFRLIRGCPVDHISNFFRSHAGQESTHPDMPPRYDCDLKPSKTQRGGNTLQTGSITFTKDTLDYGNEYHLVVRCMGGWATDELRQRFAIVVELEHQIGVQLYARLRPRLRT